MVNLYKFRPNRQSIVDYCLLSILQFYFELYKLFENHLNYWKLFYSITVIFLGIKNVNVHAGGDMKFKRYNKKNKLDIKRIGTTLFPKIKFFWTIKKLENNIDRFNMYYSFFKKIHIISSVHIHICDAKKNYGE